MLHFLITPQGLTLLTIIMIWLALTGLLLVIAIFRLHTLLQRIYLSGILTGRIE